MSINMYFPKYPLCFFIFFICLSNQVQALQLQEPQVLRDSNRIHYTVVHNIVPPNFGFPLIGLVNTANGDQRHVQAGVVNTNTGHFSGLQFGAANIALKSFRGLQAGFLNYAGSQSNGLRFAFVNTTLMNSNGGQFGALNTTGGNHQGIQLGMLNSVGKKMTGIQFGLFNKASSAENALQIGLINWADTSSNSLSVALIPIVRKGGYTAIDIGISEFYPLQSSFKLGMRRFYSSFSMYYDPRVESSLAYAFGMGFGKKFRGWELHPEIQTIRNFSGEAVTINQFMLNFLVDLPSNFQLMLTPSLGLQQLGGESIKSPWLSIYSFEKDDYMGDVGFRAGIRYKLNIFGSR
ncbi:hypothetical protein JKA74_09745 [Marivirga sp. S37H4]|uniref:DUF5723 domain-containing protein n=1 Tax=Marivirga aurantiaca TaxID=2802615 RepID=A0A934WY51_9BACT|nr:hypothetical protein [Marivirga aurantiaca]MBK6265323.1 hypothetical protein [Marivirga aurantiaca]